MIIKKKYLMLIGLQLLYRCVLFAQQYSISGVVQSKQHKDLPQASISLQDIFNRKIHSINTVSDSTGYYRFEELPAGRYILTASHVGYLKAVSDTIITDVTQTNYTYHFVLAQDRVSLKEVIITGKKQQVEMDKGKIVFNVQSMATTSGLTAFDLLKKMPGVTIDENENIILRGSSGVNVLIDGKMTYLSGTQLTNYLKGISAEDINKIELNLTPSAEYDAAGNAGIINIVPKKNLQKGYAVDIRSGITKGRFLMVNENISASHRSKKLNLYGSLDYKMPYGAWNSTSGNTINENGQMIELQRHNQSEYKIKYYTWRSGAEWQFLLRHHLSIDYLGYLDDYKSINNADTIKSYDDAGKLVSFVSSTNILDEPYHYGALSLNYRFDIDSIGKRISAEMHYVSYSNYSDGVLTTTHYDDAGNFTGNNILKAHQPGFIKIRSAKADAELPFKKLSIKAGLKYAEVSNDNQYRFDSLHNGNYEEVDDMSNHFKYNERIAAAYISASKKINKTGIDAGLRYEYTKANGYTIKRDVSNKWEYGKLFPAISIEQEISSKDKINFSASRRINRPSYSQLNPVRWYTDQYFYYAGNPNLVPEITWIFSAGYTLRSKYVLTATYGLTSNYMNRKLTIDTDGYTIKSQQVNLGQLRRFDMIASFPFQIFSFWEIQLAPDVAYMSYPISQLLGEKILSRWTVTLSAQQHFKLPYNTKMDISTEYYSAGLRGMYVTHGGFYTDIGFKKPFFKNRLDAQLTVSDVFNTSRYQAVSGSNITNYHYNEKPDTRRLGITLHYHFGSNGFKENNKKTEEQERL
jgi:hypothetical protein